MKTTLSIQPVVATLPGTKAIIERLFDGKFPQFLGDLRDRWQDEKAHEDFAEYAAAVKKQLPAEIELVRMTKSPFGFSFTVKNQPGAVYVMQANNRSVRWGRKS